MPTYGIRHFAGHIMPDVAAGAGLRLTEAGGPRETRGIRRHTGSVDRVYTMDYAGPTQAAIRSVNSATGS